ncbi:MAG: MBL fold metallo-hydrolase [Eubacteriales bacterium]
MKITALIENTGVSYEYAVEHGLSILIEAGGHKILFDTGSSGGFADNAAKMGIDISSVDTVVISHAHYDHGGGMSRLLKENNTATIWLHEKALGDYYSARPSGTAYIGLDKGLSGYGLVRFSGGYTDIGDGLALFSEVSGRELFSQSNKTLLMRQGDGVVPDEFLHEQSLIVEQDGKSVLFAGCAHCGIVNILERYRQLRGGYPHSVFGGFHLFNPSTGKYESPEYIRALADRSIMTGSRFYTCHCTGAQAYARLRTIMGEQINYFSTGSIVVL